MESGSLPVDQTAPQPGLPPADTPTLPAQPPVGSLEGEAPAPTDPLPPVTHNEPILAAGAAGDAVERLVRLLAACGYATNTIVRGENAGRVLDDSVLNDVHRFCDDHGVSEPADLFAGREVAASAIEGSWIGPHIWQALYDEAAKLTAAA